MGKMAHLVWCKNQHDMYIYIYTGWWFGTCFFLPYIGNVIIPTDFHIYQRLGRSRSCPQRCRSMHRRIIWTFRGNDVRNDKRPERGPEWPSPHRCSRNLSGCRSPSEWVPPRRCMGERPSDHARASCGGCSHCSLRGSRSSDSARTSWSRRHKPCRGCGSSSPREDFVRRNLSTQRQHGEYHPHRLSSVYLACQFAHQIEWPNHHWVRDVGWTLGAIATGILRDTCECLPPCTGSTIGASDSAAEGSCTQNLLEDPVFGAWERSAPYTLDNGKILRWITEVVQAPAGIGSAFGRNYISFNHDLGGTTGLPEHDAAKTVVVLGWSQSLSEPVTCPCPL